MNKINKTSWFLLLLLAIIWGSSFILMKEGLKHFNSFEVASLRIALAGISLLPFVKWKNLNIKKKDIIYFFISGFIGSAIPAFLFTAAQTKIPSSLAGALNGLTPLFALLVGVLFIGIKLNRYKLIGGVVGLVGAFILVINQEFEFSLGHTFLIILATLCYGINVNIIKYKLGHYPPLLVAAVPLAIIASAGVIILCFLNFSIDFNSIEESKSLIAIVLLAVIGTAVSLILFNKLIQKTNVVFASSVTYLIPIVALFWGVLDKEPIGLNQLLGMFAIILAIWLIRKK